ncbi:TIGR03620 family F420-dependent LLM class oxidoreductase [Streptomyces albireticuli]|uniref:LLM class F420-dependent oxidoreductase n=1 Tax=Streptomyces albireticuli TaxID=1940 RepID=A0A2A2D8Q2_9ACTN|nr:TIGR03620 family F420-dependent LLM class oxidoreductase [Streptomyces albireticuli]MCD9193442.1 TIGR03620 family F420-dependent LLM class oxidoreductase [Streptomyces albireticuli]PAU47871.1 LLM class F420-dependent oxidoreductase [Streptomyces albireticuli]
MAPLPGLGPIGIWSNKLQTDDPDDLGRLRDAAAELEELGYAALWIGGSPSLAHAAHLLAATNHITVGTSILSIWQHQAADVTRQRAALAPADRERLLLGLGVSHARFAAQYNRPYSAMRDYLTALDTAPEPVPADRRVLAAIGPKMLRLAGDRAAGAIPYLVTPEFTAQARTALGDQPFLGPEMKAVLDTDEARARATARDYLTGYLTLPNYTNNLQRAGYTEDDFTGGGSNRLVDALVALGDGQQISTRIEEFRKAGADHVAVQIILPPEQSYPELLRQYRELAQALPL